MACESFYVPSFILILSLLNSLQATDSFNPSQYFALMKNTLSGDALSTWDSQGENSFCNYTGITCNIQGQVTKLNISGWSLKGSLPPYVCSYLTELRVLDISNNLFQGKFPDGIINCSLLEVLNLSSLYLSGKLPNFSRMKSLRSLDLSYNLFDGDFPMSIMNLTNLEAINFNENSNLKRWELPENITQLKRLKSLILSTSMVQGQILPSIGNMTSLADLELSGNYLRGQIPPELGNLKNLKSLMLYYNELTGSIPDELGNLTDLTDMDMSVNKLTGSIPDSLCRLPKLKGLQLYNNSLTGELPSALGNSTTLSFISIYDNFLTGQVPKTLGKFSPMVLLDLSENHLSGTLPPEICNGGKLVYFLVLSNMLTGEIPENYAQCTSLVRFRVSNNHLQGSIPQGLFGLPHVSIIDLAVNQLTGPIAPSIGNAKNLSEFFAENNRLSGTLPLKISGAVSLVKIDLSNNLLFGPIPKEIGDLKKLNLLLLRGNKLNSSIPDSLVKLKSLNLLDLSNNQLTGNLPESLSELIPNSVNFSYNHLYGPIPSSLIEDGLEESFVGNPGLCVTAYTKSSFRNFPQCAQTDNQKKLNLMWLTVALIILFVLGTIWVFKRRLSKGQSLIGHDETMSSSFCSYDVKSFHRISFNQCEILEAMVDKNILGHGGSGTVYRMGLSNGEIVAVKKLWSRKTKDNVSDDQLFVDKELETEVQTLGNIRHKNIVKLYSYLSNFDSSLLVYEYMPNGNLWDALHKGKILLDWPTRHQIALGVAQGLAYLHHDLLRPIVHRDIKSSNILLDVDFQPKVADFGVAKVLQAKGGKDSSNTIIAGTYGYMDPDYATTSKATTKCDVYSYGVVLMELVTGKKPVEAEFGENKNIINWVSTNIETKEGAMEILDKQISGMYREDMIQVIRLAIRCTARTPTPRPTMSEIVQFLSEIDPCRFDSRKSTKDTMNPTKINKTCQL
ncbi:receptor protein-tyrosine kinase CEPR1 [Amaranthus tricolor]|uniref:receptor protein-tyrosine kinase CEPR1 n=1 Tax=Amaranthus tricolor TaxID=29722 RepID=UPI00258A6837|nr:receptor protein-tyrosine kinase CEPR1 [Amaranthus tricolor]